MFKHKMKNSPARGLPSLSKLVFPQEKVALAEHLCHFGDNPMRIAGTMTGRIKINADISIAQPLNIIAGAVVVVDQPIQGISHGFDIDVELLRIEEQI